MTVDSHRMRPSILIVIPCFNEANNIKEVVADLRETLGEEADILIVDDSSNDGTREILPTLDAITLLLPFNLGYSGALQTGYKYAVNNKYRYVVQFDGDGQHRASEIRKLLSVRETSDADIVIGSRFAEGTSHRSLLKRGATSLFRILIKSITGVRIDDPTSGLQLLNQRVLRHYSGMSNFPYYPDANIIIEMILSGYRVKEVQVTMRDRLHGTSMHTGLMRQGRYMVRSIYSICIIALKYFPFRMAV